jgi:drug/metabolite transporter (DMT)-like permease
MAPIRPPGLQGRALQPSLSRSFFNRHPPLSSATPHQSPSRWLANQPCLLLALASLFWAGNIVLARHVAGHVPPLTLSCVRWIGTFLMLWPFARPHLKQDWPVLRARWPLLLLLALTGFAANNALSYWAMQYTQALNGLLIQSSTPLFVALWSLLLFGVRLTAGQLIGIVISLIGVLVILLRGDLGALAAIQFNRGDLMFAGALLVFGLYSALMSRRPKVHQLSLISFCTAAGALLLAPLAVWEYSTGSVLRPDLESLLTLGYVVVFASTLAYLFFNRGISLIGPNRAAPFLHLVPVFGSVLAIVLLGEELKPFHLIGYALVLAGVLTASRPGRGFGK